ncbi:MAG TPA: zinc ribbon domain-containing protein [Longimicrobiales bacterium]|nr:zinc ribbon domain-containing protein [Longimicrobiales bacterium]
MEMLVIGLIAVAAFAAVLFPLFRRRPGFGDETEFENIPPASTVERTAAGAAGTAADAPRAAHGAAGGAAPDAATGEDPIEAEVMRYREAVRAGTVCRKCGQANPADSLYCFECGARLPLADAREFE